MAPFLLQGETLETRRYYTKCMRHSDGRRETMESALSGGSDTRGPRGVTAILAVVGGDVRWPWSMDLNRSTTSSLCVGPKRPAHVSFFRTNCGLFKWVDTAVRELI